jgi:hypothetical protein
VVVVENETPVASLVSATLAVGMTAPVGSATVPTTLEVVPCANKADDRERARTALNTHVPMGEMVADAVASGNPG